MGRCNTIAGLQWATALVFAYLCVGEIMPCLPGVTRASRRILDDWAAQQVILIAVLSCSAVLLASTDGRCEGGSGGSPAAAKSLLKFLNVVPVMAAVLTTYGFWLSGACPLASGDCDYLAVVLDAVGMVSARLARLDLGICLLLAVRGGSSLVFGAAGLGFPESIPLHRGAGWWCAGQSALHSVAYALFYLHDGGLGSFWISCFPAALPDNILNTLGLVNGLGLLAFLISLALVAPAVPWARQRYYHVFQRLHLLTSALFVVACALHDLPILFFAVPGLASWYLDRFGASTGSPQLLRAKARVLSGASGPWVELIIERNAAQRVNSDSPQWVSVRVLELGRERHPLSVCWATSTNLGLLVTASAGDWSQALATLCLEKHTFEVEMAGPFPAGSVNWCQDSAREQALLVVAGGTGVTEWLPTMVCDVCAYACVCSCVRLCLHASISRSLVLALSVVRVCLRVCNI